jgi:hypothetical protein
MAALLMAMALVPASTALAEPLEPTAGAVTYDGQLVNISTGLAGGRNIEIPSTSTTGGGTQAALANDTVVANQRFLIEDAGSGYYYLRNLSSGMVLDIYGNALTGGPSIIQWPEKSANNANQKWQIIDNGNGTVSFASALNANYVIDIYGNSSAAGAKLILWSLPAGGTPKTNQTFILDEITAPVADGSYTIQSELSENLLLDIYGKSVEPGAKLITWTPTGLDNQKFDLVYDAATGYYSITAGHSGLALDIYGASKTAGAKAIQWTAHTRANQQWAIVGSGDAYSLISAHSNLALDVTGKSLTPGAEVISWTITDKPNQQWNFVPVVLPDTEVIFTVYTQSGSELATRVPVVEYTMTELRALAAVNTEGVAYVTGNSHNDSAQVYYTENYVTIDQLLADNDLTFRSGDILYTDCVDDNGYGRLTTDDWTYQILNSQRYYYPATTASGLTFSDPVEVPAVLALDYAQTGGSAPGATPFTSTAAAWVAEVADGNYEANLKLGDSPRSLFGASSDTYASNRFAKWFNRLTLSTPPALQELPIYEVYASDTIPSTQSAVEDYLANNEPDVLLSRTDLETLAAENEDPLGYMHRSGVSWTIHETKNYVTFEQLEDEFPAALAAGDSLVVVAGDGFGYNRPISYETLTATDLKFFPAATNSSSSLDGAVAVPPVLALSYANTILETTAGATLNNLAAGTQNATARFFIGTSESGYLSGTAPGNRFATGPVALFIVHPDPVVLTLYAQTGTDEKEVAATFTQAELDALAVTDSPLAYYAGGNNNRWSVYYTANYVPLADLLDEADLTFGVGQIIKTDARDSFVSTNDDITWDMWTTHTNWYPAGDFTGTIDTTDAETVPAVLALTFGQMQVTQGQGTMTAAQAVVTIAADFETYAKPADYPRSLLGSLAPTSATTHTNRYASKVNSLTLWSPA